MGREHANWGRDSMGYGLEKGVTDATDRRQFRAASLVGNPC